MSKNDSFISFLPGMMPGVLILANPSALRAAPLQQGSFLKKIVIISFKNFRGLYPYLKTSPVVGEVPEGRWGPQLSIINSYPPVRTRGRNRCLRLRCCHRVFHPLLAVPLSRCSSRGGYRQPRHRGSGCSVPP